MAVKKKKKVGRPHKKPKLNKEQIKQLASMGLIQKEISAVSGISVSTLQRNYDTIIKEGLEHLKASLKRKQYQVAMTGNVSMLIWLGKQYLDQKDKQELSGDTTSPLGVLILPEKKYVNDKNK